MNSIPRKRRAQVAYELLVKYLKNQKDPTSSPETLTPPSNSAISIVQFLLLCHSLYRIRTRPALSAFGGLVKTGKGVNQKDLTATHIILQFKLDQ